MVYWSAVSIVVIIFIALWFLVSRLEESHGIPQKRRSHRTLSTQELYTEEEEE